MTRTRKNVWTLPAGDKTLEWYGKAIEVLQQRDITDPTSWWSLGAIHGFDPAVWQGFGFIKPTTPLPPQSVQNTLWAQCQHLTWYFLPWHRGYLMAFENIVLDAIKKLGGPSDWALPYWNYSDDRAFRELPKAFASPTLPGGGRNFLHVKQRYGSAQFPNVQSPLTLDARVVAVSRTLAEKHFQGNSSGGSTGFGGLETAFSHGDEGSFGVLESQPHGPVHVWVGGGFQGSGLSTNPLNLGLMTNPDTAALDPIFWLHHANIDRLWNVWLRQPKGPGDPPDAFQNPVDRAWLDGPRDRTFVMPRIDGEIEQFTARQMLNTDMPPLDYVYDDDAVVTEESFTLAGRFQRLGASLAKATELSGAVKMAPPKTAELVGANASAIQLNNDVVETRVRLDSGQKQRLSKSLDVQSLESATARAPDRVYLNLENIKSPSDAALFYVYVNLPDGADPESHPDQFAGTVSMFGVSKASDPQGPTGGTGVTTSLDITSIIDKMHIDNGLADDVSVKLVSAVPGATSDDISIGRISIYRQGQ